MQHLLSLPQNLISQFHSLEGKPDSDWFVASDPVDKALGSGGGTAYLLYQSWKQQDASETFEDWLERDQRVLIHAGGKSRRLPAYAATGKVLSGKETLTTAVMRPYAKTHGMTSIIAWRRAGG